MSQQTVRAARARTVTLAVEERDPVTGVRVRRLQVSDESDHSPARADIHAAVQRCEEELLAHPDWEAPEHHDGELVLNNPASEWLYSSPGMLEWRRDLVPSARALYPMQRPSVTHLPSGGVLDEMARQIFINSVDGIGIRTRAAVMADIVADRADLAAGSPQEATWVSLACGAAVPVLDALAAVGGGNVLLHLVDMDPDALEFARELANGHGLEEGRDFTIMERNLITAMVARTDLLDELGRGSADVVDALGIFEYFSDASCVRLLRNAFELVAPGGILIVANMMSDRPQLAMNQRGVGWPRIHPRSVDDMVRLVTAAGLPTASTSVHLPQDGVYGVMSIDKAPDHPRVVGGGEVIDLRG